MLVDARKKIEIGIRMRRRRRRRRTMNLSESGKVTREVFQKFEIIERKYRWRNYEIGGP